MLRGAYIGVIGTRMDWQESAGIGRPARFGRYMIRKKATKYKST